MKTKFLLLSMALAAVCLEASRVRGHCQIVGYATVSISPGYNFVANQFDAGDNTVSNVLSSSSPPFGTAVYLWNVNNQGFAPPALYTTNGWSTNVNLPPPTGFVLNSPSAWTLTFSGQVLQGTTTTPYAGAGKFSLLASAITISQALAGPNIAFPSLEGENVFLYSATNQNFSDAFTWFTGYGWYDPDGVASTNGPVINGGQSFFAQNLGPNTNWVQTFNGPTASLPSQPSAKATIQSIRATPGKVTLIILDPGGGPYNVQFSRDGTSWTTLATSQTGTTWRGALPASPQGYFRLTNP